MLRSKPDFILTLSNAEIIPKCTLSITVLTMVCCDGLFPAIFLSLNIDMIAGLILSVFNDDWLSAVIFASLQVMIMGYLLATRWQKRMSHG